MHSVVSTSHLDRDKCRRERQLVGRLAPALTLGSFWLCLQMPSCAWKTSPRQAMASGHRYPCFPKLPLNAVKSDRSNE